MPFLRKRRPREGGQVMERGPPNALGRMKLTNQTRKEACGPTPFASSRKIFRIGTWNVRTMYETGKSAQISMERFNYNLDIIGLSETHWIGSGEIKISSGDHILYSGHEDEMAHHTQGVGFLLSRQARKALIGWEAISPRLLKASFRTSNRKIRLNIIQTYAPTNEKEDAVKECFYQQIQTAVDELRKGDINIIMGDMNAKIGQDNTGFEEVMGNWGMGDRSENGDLFVNFCAMNDLVIGGSIFPHKQIHKITWVSPDKKTKNQIDHICINRRFRRSLVDVRAYRGAEIASDHYLVIAKLKIKLKYHKSNVLRRTVYNTDALQNQEITNKFSLLLTNKFKALESLEDTTVEDHWTSFKETIQSTCEEMLGNREHTQKAWISEKTLLEIKERKNRKETLLSSKTRTAKSRAIQDYQDACNRVKKSIIKDKQAYIDKLADTAEEAAKKGNMGEVYQCTRKLSGKYKKANRPVKSKEGKTLSTTEEQRKRWVEHFKELLNRPDPDNPPQVEEAPEDLPIDCNPPSKKEILRAIMLLKSKKAPGPDSIPPEALKARPEIIAGELEQLFYKIWNTETIPNDWTEGYIIKIPKKGNLEDCRNYRGITLLSIPGKVFNRILLDRMKDTVDKHLRDEQAGFRPSRSCTDQICTLRIIIEQSNEWNSPVYMNFVDYEKAFDSVNRETLWKIARHYGIPHKIVTLIKNTYENTTCRVIHEGELTDSFPIKTGVRQGCLLSPFLFLLAIDFILKRSLSGRKTGIQWGLTRQLEDLDFADDIALLSHTHTHMQEKTNNLNEESKKLGLKIHEGKTKVLRMNTKNVNSIYLGDQELQEIRQFTYLGSNIDEAGGTDRDVKQRIQKARIAFKALNNIWKSSILRDKTKLKIFNSNVKSTLLYGCETWKLTKTITNTLQSFVNTCLRKIKRIKWFDKIKNEDLWAATGQSKIDLEIGKRKWGWIGHSLRKPAGNITRMALSWNPQGKRRRGRPRASWRRDLDREMQDMGKTWRELERLAQDRQRWRGFVGGLYPVWVKD